MAKREDLDGSEGGRQCGICTINDCPAYGNLSDYSVKGHHACPICEKNTSFLQLKHGKKTMYTRH